MILNSPYISGSLTVTGNTTLQGALTVTGSLSGTASTASFALTLGGTGSVGFATTGAFTATSGSASSRLTQIEQVYATTGSNSFRATQSITGSLTVTGQIVAQTLNVQQVTSSIVYSSGSNVFGCDINSRQTFTGSFYQTGSVAVFSNTICSTNIVNSNVATCTTFVQSCTGVANSRLNAGTSADLFLGRCDNTNYTNVIYADSTQWSSCFRWSVGMRPAGSNYQIYNEVCSNTALFVCQNNNYVGIGTSAPLTTLTVKTTNDNGYGLTRPSDGTTYHWRLSTTETGGDAYTVAYNTFNNNSIFSTYSAGGTGGNIIFRTGLSNPAGESMRITCNGNIGINAPSPTYPLTRNGMTIKASGADGVEFVMLSCGDTGFIGGGLVRNGVDLGLINRTGGCLIFATNATERMWLTCNGNLLIGSNIACKGLLKVAGNAEICKTLFFNGGDGNGGAIINALAAASCSTPSYNLTSMFNFNNMSNYGAYLFIHTGYNTVTGKNSTITGVVNNGANQTISILATTMDSGATAPSAYSSSNWCITFCWPNPANSNTQFIALAG